MHRPRGDGRGFVHRLLVKLLARRVRTLALHLQQVPVRQHLPRGTSLAPQRRVRRVNGVGWCWLAVVVAALTGTARGEDPLPGDARGRFMLGQANLLLGFGPEAGAAFADLVRHDPQSPLAGDARLGQAAALRLRRRPTEARRLLDAVLAEASGALLCRARGEEVA